jgi:undecaprenyl-diphosphatase
MGILKVQFQQADTHAFLWVQRQFCSKPQMPVVRCVSASGDGWLYPFVAALALIVDLDNGIKFLYCALLAYALQVPLYMMLKRHFKCNRPADFIATFQARIKPSDQFSFPSGHMAAAFVMATEIIIFFPVLSVFVLLWAITIGSSRVLLGVHFPGDIVAGLLLGVCSALLSNQILALLNLV